MAEVVGQYLHSRKMPAVGPLDEVSKKNIM